MKKKTPKKNSPAILMVRSPVLPDGQRIDCDLTTRAYRADLKTLDVSNRSIEAVLATEDRVRVVDWERYEIIEEILRMDGAILPEQVPLLDTHNRSSVQTQLGSTRDLRIVGKMLIGRNYYSSSPDVEHAWTLCREGHLTDNSVGYRVIDGVLIEPGQTAEVGGQTYTASQTMPLRIAVKWELRENSVCPIGADPKAKTRNKQNTIATERESNMKNKDNEKLTETVRTQIDDNTAVDGQRTEQSADATGVQSAISEAEAKRIAEEAVRKELARQAAIREEAAGLGIEEKDIQRCLCDPAMTIESARAEFLKVIRARNQNKVGASVGIIVPDRSIDQRMLVDIMLMRSGSADLVLADKVDGAKRAELADKHRDMSLVDLCRQSILLDGGTVPAGRDEMIRAALNTSTLPTVLGAVYNKSLLKGYESVEPTWTKWCQIGNLSDFKTATRIRLTGDGGLEKVGDGGELKLGSETEEKAVNRLETYGRKDRFGRQAIINDDLGVLTKVPQRRGRDGQLLISELVYGVLLNNAALQDGVALFHSTHKNLRSSKALTIDNIQSGIVYFRQQKDASGKKIRVRPAFLLVPSELEFAARQYVESPLIVYGGSTATGNKNVLENVLTVIGEDLLSDTTFNANASATTWYLTGDPNKIDTIEVGFLNGRQVPVVHVVPSVSDMYIEFESYIDVGVAAQDFRGLQKNTA